MTVQERIEQKLAALNPESVQLSDDSAQHVGHEGARGGGGHYRVMIVAAAFSGKSAQERHRMVYGALAEMLPDEIHALSIQAYAPEEI
jgi:BolA protein